MIVSGIELGLPTGLIYLFMTTGKLSTLYTYFNVANLMLNKIVMNI